MNILVCDDEKEIVDAIEIYLLQGGTFDLVLDGALFKVMLTWTISE